MPANFEKGCLLPFPAPVLRPRDAKDPDDNTIPPSSSNRDGSSSRPTKRCRLHYRALVSNRSPSRPRARVVSPHGGRLGRQITNHTEALPTGPAPEQPVWFLR